MRLVSFVEKGDEQSARVGVMVHDSRRDYVLDLRRVDRRIPAEMNAFLEAGEAALALARQAVENAAAAPGEALRSPDAITICAPVPRPGKILCLGHNYSDHIGIGRTAPAEFPNIFCKTVNTVIGPGAPIVIPPVTEQVDYEAELAVVMGKRAVRVPEERAFEYVTGYTIFNDVSARDYQKRTSQWMLGKCFDTFGPMGPVLVTADEIPDPHALELSLTLNGLELQRTSTRQMIFSIPYLIAYISAVMTLEPGDLISTGTPAKTDLAKSIPPFMKPGDEVCVQISKIGQLINPITAG